MEWDENKDIPNDNDEYLKKFVDKFYLGMKKLIDQTPEPNGKNDPVTIIFYVLCVRYITVFGRLSVYCYLP